MPWQRWFLIHALELHPTETDEYGYPVFRFRKVIMLVGRQNGKSTVMQALTLWRMYVDRASLVIGTAQDLEVAESLWAESVEMAEDIEDLGTQIEKIEKGAGKKRMILKSRESYKVKAASRRGGRGLSGELVLLDELREHQTWDAWAAVTKTTNAKSRAQIYGISNAGDVASIVLRYLRKVAHAALGDPDGINAGEDPTELLPAEDADELEEDDDADSALGIFEWSAPPDASTQDRDAWAQANPALGHRIRESTLASDAKIDPEWIFRTEVMCQWSDGTLEGPFPPESWESCLDPDSILPDDAEIVACLDVSWDRSMAYVAVAGVREDGRPHVELVAQRAGTEWVTGWFTDQRYPHRAKWRIVVQSSGAPASSLVEELQAKDLEVVEWKGVDLGRACGIFYDLVRDYKLRHRKQPALDVAAATAATRPLGDAWVWDRRKSPLDCAPLVAATGAVWLIAPKPDEKKDSRVAEWPTDDVLEGWL